MIPRRWLDSLVILICLAGIAVGRVQAQTEIHPTFTLVPEMERPAGFLYQSAAERQAMVKNADVRRGLAAFENSVRELWPRLREVDLAELSRFQVDATRGFLLPEAPGELRGKAVAWDKDAGRWHLELRGPRLPARYDIVYRYLYLYATFDPDSGELGRLVVTIRGWVLE